MKVLRHIALASSSLCCLTAQSEEFNDSALLMAQVMMEQSTVFSDFHKRCGTLLTGVSREKLQPDLDRFTFRADQMNGDIILASGELVVTVRTHRSEEVFWRTYESQISCGTPQTEKLRLNSVRKEKAK